MNDTFQFARFGSLFKKTLLERPVQLSGLVSLTLLSSMLLYICCRYVIAFEEAQNISFVFGMIGGGTFLASFMFNYFSSNASGSSYLTLPASHLEKWLCGVIIAGILFPLVFIIFFMLIDNAFVLQYHNSLDKKNPYYTELYNMVATLNMRGFVAMKTYLMFVNFTAAMLVGSLYFNKAAFIRVALFVIAVIVAGEFLNYFIAQAFFNPIDKALPYYAVFIPVGNDFGKVMLTGAASKFVDIAFMYVVPVILVITAYIRLREKEF